MSTEQIASRIQQLENQLKDIDSQRDSIFAELAILNKQHHNDHMNREIRIDWSPATFPDAKITKKSTLEEQIDLYLRLFKVRTDVFAERFESKKTKKSGYQPVCINTWRRPLCQKPAIKCSACRHRCYASLKSFVVQEHLAGKITIGGYALLPNEKCGFLAADFDKDGWHNDARAFIATCRKYGLQPALERSRSGNGGHVWLFFEEEISAYTARQMGSFLLTDTMEQRPEIGLDSYDRLFPNQDTLPKGGFGNLIALPLQRIPAEKGNSLFVDEQFRVFKDQWAYLSSLKPIKASQITALAEMAKNSGRILGVHPVSLDESTDDPWTLPASRQNKRWHPSLENVPNIINIVLSDEIYVPKSDLPSSLLNEVIRLAAFQNPEFYRAQAMKLPVYGKPRIIGCASDSGKYVGLPRGCVDDLQQLLDGWHIKAIFEDKRNKGISIPYTFQGTLRNNQQQAYESLIKYETGVLSASTAFGKTVLAIKLIAKRQTNTLILVHRKQLLEQWIERLCSFLNIDRKDIGVIHGGKRKPTGIIDVSLMQSLYRKGDVDDVIERYGHLIIDECHHISAGSFELISRRCKAKYVLGLTATVVRKDGQHPIVLMQCGRIRYRANDKIEAQGRPFEHIVKLINTDFSLSRNETNDDDDHIPIHDVFRQICDNETRNQLIVQQALDTLKTGRSPVLLTERRSHLEWFHHHLADKVDNLIILHGGMGVRERRQVWTQLKDSDLESRLILATGKYLGEGFDDTRLDTLLLAMPISWRGTISQYAGRLHRLHADKRDVIIYDFVDEQVAVLKRMFDRRCKGYAALGYRIDSVQNAELFRLRTNLPHHLNGVH